MFFSYMWIVDAYPPLPLNFVKPTIYQNTLQRYFYLLSNSGCVVCGFKEWEFDQKSIDLTAVYKNTHPDLKTPDYMWYKQESLWQPFI